MTMTYVRHFSLTSMGLAGVLMLAACHNTPQGLQQARDAIATELPGQGVFAAAGTDDEDFHAACSLEVSWALAASA